MSFPVLAQLGLFLVFPIAGLALSFKFKSRPWVLCVWFLTTGFLIWEGLSLLRALGRLGLLSGPDAIGVGLALPFLGGALLVIGFGLFLAYRARPKREAWNIWSVMAAVGLCLGVISLSSGRAASFLTGYTDITVSVVDSSGQKLTDLPVDIDFSDNGFFSGEKSMMLNEEGAFKIELKDGQWAHVKIRTGAMPIYPGASMPVDWATDIGNKRKQGGFFSLRHEWKRSLGGHALREWFGEQIPFASRINMTVMIPARAGLSAPLLKEQITRAIRASVESHGDFSASMNVEALESLPWLMERYRADDDKRAFGYDDFDYIAQILSGLDLGSRALYERLNDPRQFDRDYGGGELRYEAIELGKWAGTDGTDPISGVVAARKKVVAESRLLVDFALSEIRKENKLWVLGQMGTAAYSGFPEILKAMQSDPPSRDFEIRSWGFMFLRIVPEADKAAVAKRLLASDDPRVVLVGCESIKNNLKTLGGAFAVQRLQALLPATQDKEISERIKDFLNELNRK